MKTASGEYQGGLTSQLWEVWQESRACLANREAQPVAYLNKFSGICMTLEQQPNAADDAAVYVPLYTAPPAPAYPERLPCPVHLLPGLKFGKGVPTRSMLDALVRRAEYEPEREAMTPEQKAEDDARIEAFKALLPRPPAPAVPDEVGSAIRYLEDTLIACNRFNYCADAVKRVENACRAAMLAQHVSGGYTLPEDTRRMDWLVAHHVTVRKPLRYGSEAMFTAQTITDEEDDYHATKLREQIDAAMLAAAPGES
ncbi:hypothetical protein [Serratia sp. (in: enterobacteria)]|uniref:hypothetical protein n=1 Tax=Serratia sp. (in: enterobacteria) TaxID=616 RepID=UPI003F3F6FF6